jgi:hypothetical protein
MVVETFVVLAFSDWMVLVLLNNKSRLYYVKKNSRGITTTAI